MRPPARRLVTSCALLLATAFAAPASATQPDPLLDWACGFATIRDPRLESSYSAQAGYLNGGPIRQSGTLTCTIKVDAATHAAPYEHGTSASATGIGVTVLPPTVAEYISPPDAVIYLCDEFTDADGVTWYFDGDTFDWSTDENAACQVTVTGTTAEPIWVNPVFELLDSPLDLVEPFAAPVVCPVLAALSPGAPPVIEVRTDGDTYVGGALLLDCPPWGPDEDLVATERLRSLTWPAPSSRTLGVIRVSDTGAGPSWSVTGTLVSVDWRCGAAGTGVVCDWHGYQTAPTCREAGAVAAVLAPGARARGRVSCVRGEVVESATTDVASASGPVTYAERPMTQRPVTSLRCEADDGTGGPPVAPYVTTCGFVFGP